MIAFWVAAAFLSAAVAILIVLRAARAAERGEPEDPSLGVYRRQLAEIDDLAARGLLPQSEHRSARTEAARRLLAAADAQKPAPASGRRPVLILALAAAAPLIALVIYLIVGSPQTPDQPFAGRLAAWTAEANAPETASQLTPPQIAAVLRPLVARHPTDQGFVDLAHAEVDSNDPAAAERDLRKAIAFDPGRAELWQYLGQTIAIQAPDGVSTEALADFKQAATLDPKLDAARYYLGHEQIATGDVPGGLATWRALNASLAATDPARPGLLAEIALVQKTGGFPVNQPQPGSDQQTLIQAMVAKLAARLKSEPDDPQGWGRLIRSYGVLGDTADQTAAIASARAEFKNRPDAWRAVQAAEAAPQ